MCRNSPSDRFSTARFSDNRSRVQLCTVLYSILLEYICTYFTSFMPPRELEVLLNTAAPLLLMLSHRTQLCPEESVLVRRIFRLHIIRCLLHSLMPRPDSFRTRFMMENNPTCHLQRFQYFRTNAALVLVWLHGKSS